MADKTEKKTIAPSRRLLTAAAVAVGAAVGLAACSTARHEIRTEIEIDQTPAAAWATFAAFGTYSHWNPFIKKLEGDLAVGATLNVTLQPPGGDPMDFTPEVLEYEPGRALRWVGHFGVSGVLDGEHSFRFEQTEDGRTRFVHGERFTGLLTPVFALLMSEQTQAGFEAMNQALKARAEERPGSESRAAL